MVASILYFLLGFLTAVFIGLAVAPAVWRRAVVLTEKRIDATVPMSLEEVRAEKDALRAENAMAVRRLEMANSKLNEKAASLEADGFRMQEKIKALSSERDDKIADIKQLNSLLAEAHGELEENAEDIAELTKSLETAELEIDARSVELVKLGQDISESNLNMSNLEIELAMRESELARRAEEMRALREKLREAENRGRELKSDLKVAVSTQKTNQQRAGELETKLEKLLASEIDLEEKLTRRDDDLKRLRAELKEKAREATGAARQLKAESKRATKLESDLERLNEKMSGLLAKNDDADVKKAVAQLSAARDKLQRELAGAARENEALTRKLASSGKSAGNGKSGDNTREDNKVLRDKINEIAAKVVYMTAMLEGDDSPINEVLEETAGSKASKTSDRGKVISLAERIRSLQKDGAAK